MSGRFLVFFLYSTGSLHSKKFQKTLILPLRQTLRGPPKLHLFSDFSPFWCSGWHSIHFNQTVTFAVMVLGLFLARGGALQVGLVLYGIILILQLSNFKILTFILTMESSIDQNIYQFVTLSRKIIQSDLKKITHVIGKGQVILSSWYLL